MSLHQSPGLQVQSREWSSLRSHSIYLNRWVSILLSKAGIKGIYGNKKHTGTQIRRVDQNTQSSRETVTGSDAERSGNFVHRLDIVVAHEDGIEFIARFNRFGNSEAFDSGRCKAEESTESCEDGRPHVVGRLCIGRE